jgi:hypothetical protein
MKRILFLTLIFAVMGILTQPLFAQNNAATVLADLVTLKKDTVYYFPDGTITAGTPVANTADSVWLKWGDYYDGEIKLAMAFDSVTGYDNPCLCHTQVIWYMNDSGYVNIPVTSASAIDTVMKNHAVPAELLAGAAQDTFMVYPVTWVSHYARRYRILCNDTVAVSLVEKTHLKTTKRTFW